MHLTSLTGFRHPSAISLFTATTCGYGDPPGHSASHGDPPVTLARMRILISADMEGVTGVTHPLDVTLGTPQFERFRQLFMGDVNAAVAGLFAGGADEVLVNEAHCAQRNLPLENLDARATMITGSQKPLSMMEGIEDVDGVAFVGYHAGAGGPGVLAHTYLSDAVTGVWINAEPASEGRMNALLAAEYGVPVVLVTGDDVTCADAHTYAPGARMVTVKRAVSRYTARCLPPSATAAAIQAAAKESTEFAHRRPPEAAGPYTYEIEFDAAHLPLQASAIPSVEPTGDRRVRFTLPTMYEAIRCFKVVTAITNGSRQPTWT